MNLITQKNNIEKLKYFLINTLLFSTTLLNNSTTSLVFLFVIFIACIILMSNYTISIEKVFFATIIIISILLNLFNIEFKDLIRAIQISLAFLFFPLKIDKNYINRKLLGFILFFIAIMTISNILGLSFENSFKTKFYPIELNPWAVDDGYYETSESIFSIRFSTFFYNPNLLGQTTILILVIYLIKIHERTKDFFDFLVILSGLLCLIVSGGRTSFLIFSVIFFFTVITRMRFFYKFIFIFFIAPLLIYKISETRLLQILSSNEDMDSVGIKFSILNSYLHGMKFDFLSSIRLFFGTMKSDIQFDNDIGSIFYFSGFISLLYFIYFFINQFIKTDTSFKPYFAFCLISISGTIIFNFKFCILTIIILSILRNSRIKIKSKKLIL